MKRNNVLKIIFFIALLLPTITTLNGLGWWWDPPGGGDTTPPSLSFVSPSAGASVSGTITVKVIATDSGSGMDLVSFYIDNSFIANDYTSSNNEYSVNYNTNGLNDGSHTLKAIAFDNDGNYNLKTRSIIKVTPEKIAVFFYDSTLIDDEILRYNSILQDEGFTKFYNYKDCTDVQGACQTIDSYESAEDTIFVYIIGHGNNDGSHSYTAFDRLSQEIVYSNDFKGYMDNWEAGRKCILVESCHAGDWADDFNEGPYLAMASSDETHTSWQYSPFSTYKSGVFTHYFFEHVEDGYSAVSSYYYAKNYVMEEELLHSFYNPFFDEWVYCQPQYPKIRDNSAYTWFT
ncbi:MAG: hypothetical protein FK733_11790 [Asgard group archaeon]|nr:hypothetical protein [Asgard group archaeon]